MGCLPVASVKSQFPRKDANTVWRYGMADKSKLHTLMVDQCRSMTAKEESDMI